MSTATITTLNEAISQVDTWQHQAADMTTELQPDHPLAAMYSSGREAALLTVLDYLRTLDTTTAEPTT